jgi:DNA-binding NtrC family response regulator
MQTVPAAASTGPQPQVVPKTPEELLGVGVTFKDAKERWVSTFERDYILQTLRRNSGNISHAAREADIDRKYYRKLMKKYDIEAAGVDDADDAAE